MVLPPTHLDKHLDGVQSPRQFLWVPWGSVEGTLPLLYERGEGLAIHPRLD